MTSIGLRDALEAAATIVVAVVWFVALRPVALGGPATYLFVHGYSMSGALAPGDLVFTTSQSNYSVGDAIVYRVPSGAGRGLLVVHRIIGIDPSGYRMQGDSNSYQDPWRPGKSDIVGHLVLTVPGLGRVLAWLANPFVLAATWGLAVLIIGLSFLPDSPAPKRPFLTVPKRPVRPTSKPRTRRHMRHPALDAAAAIAVSLLAGLVIVSAVAVISPAYAARLIVHNDRFTARVAYCSPAPPFPGTCS